MSTSLSLPPNRFALGSAPFASLSVRVSLPARPKTWISWVFATVGLPPATAIAPPLTRMPPAALRLTVIALAALSPFTLSTPALKVAVVAALAGAVVAAARPAASTVPASSRRAARPPGLRPAFIVPPSNGSQPPDTGGGDRIPFAAAATGRS